MEKDDNAPKQDENQIVAERRAKLKALRGLPSAVLQTLELLPAAAHPMDVLRSGVSALGCILPEAHDHNQPGARDIADRLMASLGSMGSSRSGARAPA